MFLSRRHILFGSLTFPVLAAKKSVLEHPNVVLILVDGLPAWVLGAYGNKEIRTPNLDRLAQTGTRFSNHFACTPSPEISLGTTLTGRTPMQLGDAAQLPPGEVTLEKVLSGAGYTAASAGLSTAAQTLEQQTTGKPFLLTVRCPPLRAPYDVAAKYRDLYSQSKFDSLNLDRAPSGTAQTDKEMLSDIVGNVRKAAAAITALDEEIAPLLAKLAEKRLTDQTLVIFTSTCGSLLGRHGLWDAGAASDPVNMYEEAVATPMLWSWPGRVPAQAVRPELVSTYDLMPTLCDLVAVGEPARNLCGRSYLLLATGKPLPKKQPWRKTIFGYYESTGMARIERYKVVVREPAKGPGELYDLVADPGERVNQYDNQNFLSIRTSLSDSFAAWKQRYSA